MNIGLYCYAWDFADNGVDKLLDWCSRTGITHLFLAATYHSGWFLHSHDPRHKAYMASSGAVYFHPQTTRYGCLQPLVAPLCHDHDYFREVCEKAQTAGIKVVAWTIGAHNTRLGLLHPDCCVTNCFGDAYPHALCPLHLDVRQYLMALCGDIGVNFPVDALALESFAFMGWKHDHHHAREFHALSELEVGLMGLCFNPATMTRARDAGIDASAVQQGVRRLLQAAFEAAPERPAGHPRDWIEAEAELSGLAEYRALIAEANRNVLLQASAVMQPAICHNAVATTLGGYGRDATYLQENLPAARTRAGSQPLWVTFRLGAADVPSLQFLKEFVGAAREGEADGMVFYNYSEAPLRLLQWLEASLQTP